ncbi:degenerin-like protein del-10 [Lineus longissimus]|uniref:degenerin-like protein del-10 n=1 Tax=Lineus longissimus TaxID=88925 RepID=UPI00315D035F
MMKSWDPVKKGGMATRLHQGTFSCPNLREESNEESNDGPYDLPPSYTSLPHLSVENPRGYKNRAFEIENGDCGKGNRDSVEYGKRRSSTRTDDTKAVETPETLAENFLGFTQYTSFHGVHFMWELGTTWFRRVLWFLLFFGSLTFLVIQICNRIIYLASAPVMAKVEINFNKTIRFPSVALCNQNAYRITKAAAAKKLDLIKAIYQPHEGTKDELNVTSILKNFNATNLTEKELLITMGHTKEDMIVSCKWEGVDCGPHNFTLEFTDHGLCYIFNIRAKNALADAPDNSKVTKNTGLNAGLRLTLNAENYEAMIGPHDSAGLKFLLFDRNDIASVFEMGLGMPTGSHAFIGLSVNVMKRVEPPYGNCTKTKTLKYFTYYTQMACRRECWTDFFVKNCGCTLPYMEVPGVKDCLKDVAMRCENETKGEFEKNVEACSCQPGCETFFYQPNLSYLKSAKADVYKLFQIANKTKLQEKFSKARDTVTATRTELLAEDAGMINKLVGRAVELRKVLNDELPKALDRMQKHIEELIRDAEDVFKKINEVYDFQKFVLDWNFYRPVVSKYTSYFNPVTLMYRELIIDSYRKFERITGENGAAAGKGDVDLKRSLQAVLDDRLAARSTLSRDAKDVLLQVKSHYTQAKAMDTQKYKAEYSVEQHAMIIPKTVLSSAVTLPKQAALLKTCETLLVSLRDSYTRMGKFLVDVFFHKVPYRRDQFQAKWTLPYEKQCTKYDTNLGMVMSEVFMYPLNEAAKVILTIKSNEIEISKILKEMKSTVASAMVELEDIQHIFKLVFTTATGALGIIQDESQGKTAVSKAFTAPDFVVRLNRLRNFFENTKGRNSDIQDKYNSLKTAEQSLSNLILSNTDLKPYFTKYVPVFKDKASLDTALGFTKLDEYKSLDELSPVYGRNHTRFFDAMDLVQTDMKAYLDGNKLDEKYYAANFISMDIFFRELYYQEISQQPAYTVISLLSDIGGSMGLYIGASLLSIFEIFDMLIFYCYRKNAMKKAKKAAEVEKADKEKAKEMESFNPPTYDGLVDRRHPKSHESTLSRPHHRDDRYSEPPPLAQRPKRDRDSPNRHHRRDTSPRDRDRDPRDAHDRRKKHRPDGRRSKPRRPADQRKLVDGSSSSAHVRTPTPKSSRSPLDPSDIGFAIDSPSRSPSRHRSVSPPRRDFDESDSRDSSIPDPSSKRPAGRRGGGEPDGQPDNTPHRPYYSKSNKNSQIHSPNNSATDSLGGAQGPPRHHRTPSAAKRYQTYNPLA